MKKIAKTSERVQTRRSSCFADVMRHSIHIDICIIDIFIVCVGVSPRACFCWSRSLLFRGTARSPPRAVGKCGTPHVRRPVGGYTKPILEFSSLRSRDSLSPSLFLSRWVNDLLKPTFRQVGTLIAFLFYGNRPLFTSYSTTCSCL